MQTQDKTPGDPSANVFQRAQPEDSSQSPLLGGVKGHMRSSLLGDKSDIPFHWKELVSPGWLELEKHPRWLR